MFGGKQYKKKCLKGGTAVLNGCKMPYILPCFRAKPGGSFPRTLWTVFYRLVEWWEQ